ncbi:hypothetical protein [Amycolatopsis pithecellobii]|uniref:Nuclear transport factor 2 family protein n=1 Tax=Amycolatopsis pithecellobii TaxID=664692 RepID=A0A6N7Z1R9_9PSEU|nr:hypothetical protein [Amycolatopsis pithecellobii]MTD52456.1 hypothetical protein [Amycolatopsis pithecellobii]
MSTDAQLVKNLTGKFVEFLETGTLPEGLFAEEVFLEFTMPTWWIQVQGAADVLRTRLASHPSLGSVPFVQANPTDTGFVVEFHERWHADGQNWYCREMMRAEVTDGLITAAAVYCTGDWDEARQREHAAAVTLLRPTPGRSAGR